MKEGDNHMSSGKVMVIHKLWGSVIATILAASILGGAATAKSIYDGLAAEISDRKFTLQNEANERKLLAAQVQPLIDGKLDVRMTSLEFQMKSTVDTTARIERQQDNMSEKLDKVLDRIPEKR